MLENVRKANKIMYLIQTGIVIIGLLVSLSGIFGHFSIYQGKPPKESLLVQVSIIISFALLLACCLQGTHLKQKLFSMAVLCCIVTLCGLLYITEVESAAQACILISAVLLLLLFFFLQKMTMAGLVLLFLECNLSVAWAVLQTVDTAMTFGISFETAAHTLLNIWSCPILSASLLIVYFMLAYMRGRIRVNMASNAEQDEGKNA